MQVNPSGNPNQVQRMAAQQASPVPREQPMDTVSLGKLDSLKAALSEVPASRTSEVERTQAYVEQAPYPPTEAIRKIANLLATNISKAQEKSTTEPPIN